MADPMVEGDAGAENIEMGLQDLPEGEWFLPIIFQPPVYETMELSPGVSMIDMNTGRKRSQPPLHGQMSRQEYLSAKGGSSPPSEEVHTDPLEAPVDANVADIQQQFQVLSLLYPPMRLRSPSSRPATAPSRRSRAFVPHPKDKVMGGTIVADKELLQKLFGTKQAEGAKCRSQR
ncbi:unnamed protein product [Effrenium voratum]|uniref:Uncharacterized protein n=1 Tax=Effrenium voratum TaxID=2562239 RepID=A0AA36JNJ1_9DINO|nr:unnamed protein product [Effrenium voratum]CAJ1408331.1 unnamed protein product [Effrenium voratum]CAJ1462347.1 unnamed protein product [Effrenium voratum]